MFVPLMGRAGTDTPADVIVGVLVGVVVAFMCTFGSSLWLVAEKPPKGFKRFALGWLLFVVVLAGSTFPYSANPPRLKRVFLQHTVRTVRNRPTVVVCIIGVKVPFLCKGPWAFWGSAPRLGCVGQHHGHTGSAAHRAPSGF
jgi:hypothetical protein